METKVELNGGRKSKKRPGELLSDFGMRILSLILAVVIWVILSMTQFPDTTKTITKIPVDFSMSGTAAEAKGLRALGYKDKTVDVEIKGMNYEIGAYDQNDITASVNLDQVTKAGTYQLDINVKSAHAADNVKFLSVQPETVEVKFEQIQTVDVKVTDSSPNVAAEEGYTLGGVEVTPGVITIEGPEDDLKKIAKVEAEYLGSERLSDDKTVTTGTFRLYDASGKELDSSDMTLSDKQASINYIIYKKVTANVRTQFADMPPGFDISSLPYSLSHETLQIATPQLDAAAEETINLDPISLYDISRGYTINKDIPLSGGEYEMSNIKQIEVKFELDDYAEKTFTIKAGKVEFINVPEGKQAQLDTDFIYNVSMIGPADVISGLKAADLRAVVDLSDITADGSFNHEVKIYSDTCHNIWNNGSHETSVTVGALSAETHVSSSSAADKS